mmetsp:Transcript_9606/g.8273  ORF Transcript_9606/g.8273 Transcript_9606/m.8273 type:complete len:80 (+) Transcript_9606:342-581(+)
MVTKVDHSEKRGIFMAHSARQQLCALRDVLKTKAPKDINPDILKRARACLADLTFFIYDTDKNVRDHTDPLEYEAQFPI